MVSLMTPQLQSVPISRAASPSVAETAQPPNHRRSVAILALVVVAVVAVIAWRRVPAPAQQEASYQFALFDKNAYAKLAESGAVAERQAKLTASTADQQEAAVVAARRRVDAARGGLTTARANLTNPDIREAETVTIRKQLAQQETEIASATAQTAQARA